MKRSITMLLAALFCLNLFAQTAPSKGDGSAENPYQISTAKELQWLSNLVYRAQGTKIQDSYACAVLTDDIDMKDANLPWHPIGYDSDYPYRGTFSGNGHTISNINSCIFGNVENARISDLTVSGSITSSDNNCIGAIVNAADDLVLENCTTSVNINLDINTKSSLTWSGSIGGLVGYARYEKEGSIKNCVNTGSISITANKTTDNDKVGGIIGYYEGPCTISNCKNEGDVNGNYSVGGIIGYNLIGNVEKCYNTGNIQAKQSCGGIIGTNNTSYQSDEFVKIVQCDNSGNVSGNKNVGGIIGRGSVVSIDSCSNAGEVENPSTYYLNGTGGIAGYLNRNSTITNCTNNGLIYGSNNLGGIVGRAYEDHIEKCNNNAKIKPNGIGGGIVGSSEDSNIKNCINKGNIETASYDGQYIIIGGIVGEGLNGTVFHSYNEASLTSEAKEYCYVGGIIGSADYQSIEDCYTIGDITGFKAGGIIGVSKRENKLTCSYSFGSITSTRYSKFGFIGEQDWNTTTEIIRSYYYDKNYKDPNGYHKTEDAFKNGEICYLLNEAKMTPAFFQTLGTDLYPTFEGINIVEQDSNSYINSKYVPCDHETIAAIASDCSNNGYLICEVCGRKAINDDDPAHHDYSDTTHVEPTCTAQGYDLLKCGRCEAIGSKINITQAIGHDTVINKTVPPTCRIKGYDENTCSRCSLNLGKTNYVDIISHDTVVKAVEPTCTNIGYSKAQCSMCSLLYYYCDTVSALGHDTVFNRTVAPKCNAEGYDELICKRCDRILGKTNLVDKLLHDTIFEVVQPKCTSVGYTRGNCKVCGWLLYRKDTVPALGHDKIDTTIHPTCSVEGYDITKCKRCDYTSSKTNYTAPTMDHDYDGDVCTVCKHQRIEEPELEDGFYLISNARELLWFAEYVNSWHPKVNARLITDIDMAEVCGEGIGNWEPIGKYSNRYHYFSGIFDGNAHKIYNIYHKSKQQDIALFGYVQNAVIKDLWASGLISAYDYIAGFGNSIKSSTISGCVNDIYLDLRDDCFGYAAGICINADDSKIENCLQHGTIKAIVGDAAYTKACGITADAYPNSTVKNCLNYKCNQTAKSIYTYFDKDDISSLIEISNNYTVEKDQDSILKTTKGTFTPEELCFRLNFNGINWGTAIIDSIEMVVPKAFASKIIYPSGTVTCPLNHDYKTYGYEPSKIEYLHPNHIDADNDSIYDCCGMYHSDLIFPNSDGFYEICSSEQFKDFADAVKKGFRTLNVKLTCDIDLSDYCNENIGSWNPIDRFEGIFDGQHHKISGLYINDSTSYSGLFLENKGVIKNVAITKDCKLKGKTIGAICADNQGRIEKCSNEANVEGYMAGGIVGEQSFYHDGSYLKHCYNTGDISGTVIGGIAGICNTGMDYCHSYGRINRQETDNQNQYIGGVSGLAMVEDGGFFGPLYCIETGLCPEDVEVYDFTTSAEQFASGEICYALNNGQDSTVWYQTLNVDPYPVLDPTHGKVLYDEENGVYYNYPPMEHTATEVIENKKQNASLVAFVINRKVIVVGSDSFRIIDMFGRDVTSFNGSLADGIYVVVANGNAAKVVVK